MSFKKLAATVERINSLMREASHAHDFPNDQHREADRVTIEGGRYGSPSKSTIDAAAEIKRRLVTEFRARGEVMRDKKLAAIALEVDSLRATLPALAAAASIDLGTIARANFPTEKTR